MTSDYKVIQAIEKQTGTKFTKLSKDSFEEFTLDTIIKYINQTRNYHFCIIQEEQVIGLVNISEAINSDLIQALKDLELLLLYQSQISDISFLKDLHNLNSLNLRNNQISDIFILKDLQNLNSLDLRNNEISDYSFLKDLQNLNTLDLGYNKISDISFLKDLHNLNTLDLGYNKISDISFLKDLHNLNTLDLRNNQISDISFLTKLKSLKKINLYNNKIKVFPQELLELNLKIELESDWSGELILTGNPIEKPPFYIMIQGNQAIQKYFDDLEAQGEGKLNEAKLIIVGEPEAGKSSLMESLLDPNYQLEDGKESTMGIDVKPWNFTHLEQKEREIRANIWDFGGQQIQYMTHQFFLTPDSVYILVTTNDRTNSTNFPYWFKIIHLLGEKENQYSPVLVVKNRNNNDKHKAFHFNFDKAEYIKAYPHLQIEEMEIDLNHRRSDFEALKEKIIDMITRLSIVNAPRPAKWNPIREALIKEKKDYINYEKYDNICKENSVENKESQMLLSSSLHHTGSILHFVEDVSLQDFIILNPQWAVDAVYSVIKHPDITKENGRFTQEMLNSIWEKYTPYERGNLLNLMKKENFEICFPLDADSSFIAPQLLPNIKPQYAFDESDTLKFRFQYSFMPHGIISRLIVRLSEYIHNENVWQKGVLLNKDGCHAQVIQKENNKGIEIIDIQINGDLHQRKYLLQLIRDQIDAIHRKWFKNIEVSMMIPCHCSECIHSQTPYYFEYEKELRHYQQKGKTHIDCRKSIEEVEILKLIEGVSTPKGQKEEREGRAIYANNTQTPTTPKAKEETPTPWYKEWLFISLFVSLIGGGVSWLTFSSFSWGLGVFVLIFLIMLLFSPKRRFFRLGTSMLVVGALQFTPMSGLIKIPENSFLYGQLQINPSSNTILAILLILLAGFFIWLDFKER
jgi:internalin A